MTAAELVAQQATCVTCPAWRKMDGDMGQCHWPLAARPYRPTLPRSPSRRSRYSQPRTDCRNDRYCMQHPANRAMMEPEPVATHVEQVKAHSLRDRAFELMARLLQAHGALLAADDCSVSKLEAIAAEVCTVGEAIEELAADAWEQGADGKQEAAP